MILKGSRMLKTVAAAIAIAALAFAGGIAGAAVALTNPAVYSWAVMNQGANGLNVGSFVATVSSAPSGSNGLFSALGADCNATVPTNGGSLQCFHASSEAKAGANLNTIHAVELHADADAGSIVQNRYILKLVGQFHHASQPTRDDMALQIANQTGALPFSQCAVCLGSAQGQATIGPKAWIMRDTVAETAAGGFDFSLDTFTDSFIKGPGGVKIKGDGSIVLASGSTTPPCDANHANSLFAVTGASTPYYCAGAGVWTPL
jgi:hypothetical protein